MLCLVYSLLVVGCKYGLSGLSVWGLFGRRGVLEVQENVFVIMEMGLSTVFGNPVRNLGYGLRDRQELSGSSASFCFIVG